MTTADLLAEARALIAVATKPWRYVGERFPIQSPQGDRIKMHVVAVDHPNGSWESIYCNTKEQAETVARSRTLLPQLADALEAAEPVECGLCGGPYMVRNPHPDAGKPAELLNVGAVYVCVPCGQKALHRCSERVGKAEARLAKMRDEFAATLRVVRQGLDPADPTYKIATEAIDRLEAPARPMEPGT